MKIIQHRLQDFGYLCVENLYTNRELCYIKNEIKNINYIFDSVPDIQEQRDINSGKNEDGSPKMTGNGLTLDHVYTRREYSSILSFNRKIFADPISEKMAETYPSNIAYKRINMDYSLLNRYTYGDEYLSHYDISTFSAITFFNLGKKKILGGELIFTDYDISFKFEDNFCIIFPSWVNHHAMKLESKGIFRYSLSQFGVLKPQYTQAGAAMK